MRTCERMHNSLPFKEKKSWNIIHTFLKRSLHKQTQIHCCGLFFSPLNPYGGDHSNYSLSAFDSRHDQLWIW